GQKQRIAIARCMVLDPDVLLLDEPLGALDLKLRESMKIELKLLQHQFGTTFVYITHDQSEALVMSDNVAVMKDGIFEQIGAPKDLYSQPRTAFVAGFVGDSNRWKGRVTEERDGLLKVDAEVGASLLCSAGDDGPHPVGTTVEVFVRPEFISIAPEGSPDTASDASSNRLSGKVDSLLFNGANSRVLVRSAADRLIEVDFPSAVEGMALDPGDSVQLTWPQARSKCFRATA
ncbi:MAG TPA: ABC transporter ATP-binding protein, partial [Kiloniellaceae bacterium]|nr:ABC transporter ATP-binding protein [Kiloniellaceae bacterium]